MAVVYIKRGVFPFGDQCILKRDLYHQYAPFYRELKRKLATGGSLFYDWNIGCGVSFLPLFAYYLSSPLNLFLLLCPDGLIIEFITVMILVKTGLASLTMTRYLNARRGNAGSSDYPAVFFGIFYALSGYMAAYSWNIMWLDCIWLFPVVILGLERLVRENRGLLYSFALGLTILTNFYIAVIICFGIAVYCFLFLGVEKEIYRDFGKKLIRFFLYTLLAVGLSAVLLLPYIRHFSMTDSANAVFSWKNSFYSYFSLFDVLSRHLLNVQTSIGLDHWPNVYCGVAVFLLLPFYYLAKKIPLREKIGYTLVLLFYCFSFSTRFMDYLWHVFHIPNSLPCRQSFIYIFILLTVCFRGFLSVPDLSGRGLICSMLAGLLFVFSAEKLQTGQADYGFHVFYPSAVFIGLYTLLIHALKKGRVKKSLLLFLAFALVCTETGLNAMKTGMSTVSRAGYTDYDEDVKTIESRIRAEDRELFYRTEKDSLRTKNDGAWLGLRSASAFSSTANSNLTAFYQSMGLTGSMNAYASTGRTFFTDMLMDVKYIVSKGPLYESGDTRSLYERSNDIYYYRNQYVLPLGYLVDGDALKHWTATDGMPLVSQNSLALAVSGVQDLFLDVTAEYTPGSAVSLQIPETGYYYARADASCPKEITVTGGGSRRTFTDLNKGYTMDLGLCEAGDILLFANSESGSSKPVSVKLYLFRQELMSRVYEAFARSPMTVTSFSDTKITGTVDVKKAGTLMTTIPLEEGWSVTVDGVPADCGAVQSAFLSVDLPEGRHELLFRYKTPLFLPGACISIASAAVMLLILPAEKKRNGLRETGR